MLQNSVCCPLCRSDQAVIMKGISEEDRRTLEGNANSVTEFGHALLSYLAEISVVTNSLNEF